MNWARLAVAAMVAGISVSFTDWFFFGVLFHDKYQVHPEVWRGSQEGINRAVWVILGFVTCTVFVFACARLNVHGYSAPLKLALWMWLAVALPIVATDALFIKLDPLVAVAHCLGWLTRLAVAAVCVGLLLPKS